MKGDPTTLYFYSPTTLHINGSTSILPIQSTFTLNANIIRDSPAAFFQNLGKAFGGDAAGAYVYVAFLEKLHNEII